MFKSLVTSKEGFWVDGQSITPSTSFSKDLPIIYVDWNKTFQSHMGFGGAFTGAVDNVTSLVGPEVEAQILKACFSHFGLCYNLARVPIHSTDFSVSSYTYVKDNDSSLSSFDMSMESHRFSLVNKANEISNGLWVMASPWSPPGWMKDNGGMCHGGKLKKDCYPLWGKYLAKAIKGMIEQGIKVDAISVQNEPLAVQVWESCIFTGEEEGLFLRDALVPALKEEGLGDVKIIIWDHNRDLMVERSIQTLSVPGVRDLVYGIGYHWYCSNRHSNIDMVKSMYPEKHVFLTECCVELAGGSASEKKTLIGRWEHGERYGIQIIEDFNNGSEGYIDWNLALNLQGGPNHVGNYCESPIMVDTQTGAITYMPSYYYIGHFSRYIKPSSKRVLTLSDLDGIHSVSYLNPDGYKVIVVLNVTDSDQKISVLSSDGNGLEILSGSHSIVTLYE